jgi:23S rRNA (uracil1939-C5)-methyltransferase
MEAVKRRAMDITVTPREWNPRGEAIIRKGHRRLIVWSGIPGEPALVRVYHQGQNQDMARFLEPARRPHPHRREPPCSRYTLCGGCPLMHLTMPGQYKARLHMLRQELESAGIADKVPETIFASPDGDTEYRHVVKLVVGHSDQGTLRVGARGRDGRTIVPIPRCNVATPALRKVMTSVAHHVLQLGLEPFNPHTLDGALRYIVMRQSRATGQILVTLVAGQKDRKIGELAELLAADNHTVAGIHLHFNDLVGNAIFDRDDDGVVGTLPLRGNPTITDTLGEVELRIGPGDFFQVNPAVADKIVRDVVDMFEGDRARAVVDLYSGVGGFALALGKAHGWAIGVEGLAGATVRARENAKHNNISAEFVSGDVGVVLPDIARRLDGRAPVVVVDPARRGLGAEVVKHIVELEPARLAYLSCNPRTLAEDLKGFIAAGWSVERLLAYDMFPQTAHLEVLAELTPAMAPPEPVRRPPRRKIIR